MLGEQISHYEILGRLGAGGMGEVFRARDTRLGRSVAIKVMRPGEVSESARLRFLQEAQAASALNHPGIVTIHDIVREGETLCIVQELVEGETLATRIARHPIPVDEALELMSQIVDALAVAHGRGIVHRDLKPENLMITPSGRVKILDFGLAKIDASTLSAHPNMPTRPKTEAGQIFGTFEYMSPEQLVGRAVDHRSDIFSLGTILFEMLTGRRPFKGDSLPSKIHAIAYEKVSKHDLAAIPPSVARLIESMMQKDPKARIQSAGELARAIDAIRSGSELPRTAWRASPAAVAADGNVRHAVRRFALPALLVLIAGLGMYLLFAQADRPESSQVPDAVVEVEPPPATAAEAIRRGEAVLETYWRKGAVDQAIENFQRAISMSPENGGAHAGLAIAYWRKHREDKDPAWLELARQNARHAVDLEPQMASARVALALAEIAAGDFDAAGQELEQALVLDPASANVHRALGDLALQRGDTETARRRYVDARDSRPEDSELHALVGIVDYRTGRHDEAIAALQRSIELAPDNPRGYASLGAIHHMKGDAPSAARAMQRSLELEPDPAVYSNLGTLYFFQGLYPQAVDAFEKALQLRPNDYRLWANLGDAYRWTAGRTKESHDAFTRALQLLDEKMGDDHSDRQLASQRVLYLSKAGRPEEAIAAATELDSASEKNPQNAYRFALAFDLAGERDRALAGLETAFANGYSTEETKRDPELASLRSDVRYHALMMRVEQRQ
jgi:eukaryotic-like serine/threonine-protein kinase